jgi:site-specific DNA-methyltransferase (adenine-specific)
MLIKGDCLVENQNIESGSVDLILTDLPFGTMKGLDAEPIKADNKKKYVAGGGYKKGYDWDNSINPIDIYNIANRILRKNGKLILFCQEPYTTDLINKSIPNIPFSYRAIWEKNDFANCLFSKKAMVNFYEDILIFSKHFESENNDDNPCKKYALKVFAFINKSMKELKEIYGNNNLSHFYSSGKQFRLCTESTYNKLINDFLLEKMDGFLKYDVLNEMNRNYKNTFASTFNLWEGNKYKSNILKYKKDYDGFHPTQKPVLLLEDLIKTFSNENETVLDFTMGSGTTGVACVNTNRKFIGIEMDAKYFEIAEKRINDAQEQMTLSFV